MKNILQNAINLAQKVHHDQFRFDEITPYIIHPYRVATKVAIHTGSFGNPSVIVAWLHDVMEDGCSYTDVKNNTTETIAELVSIISKKPNESYNNYIIRCRRNETVKIVKYYDILDNLTDQPSARQIEKYSEALQVLIGNR